MFKYILYLFILVGLTSCTIKQEYKFDANGGGNYSLFMDLSGAKAMMGKTDAEGEGENPSFFDDTQQKSMDSTLNILNNLPGVDNAFMKETDGVIEIGYDFQDINALNESLKSDLMGSNYGGGSGQANIQLTKKRFKMITPDLSKEESLKQAEMMGKMINIETRISFDDKKIKKCNNKNAQIEEDRKSVLLKYNLEQLLKNEIEPNLDLKIK
jgi:hypothetical protein